MNDVRQRTDAKRRLAGFGAPRASGLPDARRHSARVLRLRRFIIWSSVGISGVVLIGVLLQTLRFLPADLRFARVGLEGSVITIESPKLVGYRKDGRPYELRAKLGVQDITKPDIFELEQPEVQIENEDGSVTILSAAKGLYNAKADHADVTGGVRIYDNKHYDMRLENASMDFRANVMTSDRPVTLRLDGADVRAQSVEFAANERHASFSGEVHSVFRGEEEDSESGALSAQSGN